MHRARRAWNVIRARVGGGAVVLLYHRVARADHDPFGLCVSPENFAAHVEVLVRRARPARLRELAPSNRRLGPRSVAVTFDDAYADVLSDALPILEASGVPATVFSVSGNLGHPFWWDRLTQVPAGRARTHLRSVGHRTGRPNGESAAGLLRSLHRHLLGIDPAVRDATLDRLTEGVEVSPTPPRALSGAGLRTLQATGLVEIGAHSHTHPDLRSLAKEARVAEIDRSRGDLSALLGVEVTSFSYPFGTFAHFDRETVRQVREAGFERSCTAEPGVVTGRGDPFRLPRLWVGNWPGGEFERRLMAWLR